MPTCSLKSRRPAIQSFTYQIGRYFSGTKFRTLEFSTRCFRISKLEPLEQKLRAKIEEIQATVSDLQKMILKYAA